MAVTHYWRAIVLYASSPRFETRGDSENVAKYYSAQQAALGAVNGYIEESVTGAKVIKVFNHEKTATEEFMALNDDMRHKQLNAQFFGGIMGPVLGNSSQVVCAVVAGIGGILCLLIPTSFTDANWWAPRAPSASSRVRAVFAPLAMPITNFTADEHDLFAALGRGARVRRHGHSARKSGR
jgi:ABC-type multidrug transport system fused ATPase/permease subunit